MTIKELKKLTRKFPPEAILQFKVGSDPIQFENFTAELKFDSDKGWIVIITEKQK